MTQTFALVPADDIAALRAEVKALREAMEGCRIVPAPRWMTIQDAAKAMNCHPATIRRKAACGSLEARGYGRSRQVKIG